MRFQDLFIRLLRLLCLLGAMFAVTPIHAEQGVGKVAFDGLNEVRKLQKAGKNTKAIEELKRLSNKVGASYDRAVMRQFLAYALLEAGDVDGALRNAKGVLSEKDLPNPVRQSVLNLIIRASLEREDYRNGMDALQQWLANEKKPGAESFYLAAYASFRLERFRDAEIYMKRAFALKAKPPLEWYRLLLAVYIADKRYDSASGVLIKLIHANPKDATLWQQLAGVYSEGDRDAEALATRMLSDAFLRLPKEQLLQILGLYAYLGIPEKAARLMDEWFRTGRLETNYKNLKLQFEFWRLARESKQAERVLTRATAIAPNVRDYQMLGEMRFELGQWQAAEKAFASAIGRGKMAEMGNTHLLIGICAYNRGDHKKAKAYLTRVLDDSSVRDQARFWLSQLNES